MKAQAMKPQRQVLRAEERPPEDASSQSDVRKVDMTGSVQGQVRNATSLVHRPRIMQADVVWPQHWLWAPPCLLEVDSEPIATVYSWHCLDQPGALGP